MVNFQLFGFISLYINDNVSQVILEFFIAFSHMLDGIFKEFDTLTIDSSLLIRISDDNIVFRIKQRIDCCLHLFADQIGWCFEDNPIVILPYHLVSLRSLPC